MPEPQTSTAITARDEALARNRTTHGLYSDVTVACGLEAPADWFDFHDEILDALAPEGAVEVTLASRAAALFWRLRRVAPAEAAAIQRAHDHARRLDRVDRTFFLEDEVRESIADATSALRVPLGLPVSPPDHAAIDRILRTEAHLNKQLMHTLHELEAAQSRRRGDRTPLARVDVHGLPGA